jgi:hypothetical protein
VGVDFIIRNTSTTDLDIQIFVPPGEEPQPNVTFVKSGNTAGVHYVHPDGVQWSDDITISVSFYKHNSLIKKYNYDLKTLRKNEVDNDDSIKYRYYLVITDEMLGIPAEIETMEPETTETNEQSDENAEEQL